MKRPEFLTRTPEELAADAARTRRRSRDLVRRGVAAREAARKALAQRAMILEHAAQILERFRLADWGSQSSGLADPGAPGDPSA